MGNAGILVRGTRTQLIVDNIKCGGCAKTITHSLAELGCKNISVDPEKSLVELDNPHNPVLLTSAINKLKELGYPLIETEEGLRALALKAKSYMSCALGKIS
jgi:copper chaperone CopZ